jgi:3-oxoacyl-[acyl-carrier-protein] synthase II
MIDISDLEHALLYTGVGLEMFCLEDLTPYANSNDVGQAITSLLVSDMTKDTLQSPLDITSNILGNKYGFLAGKYINCSACAAGAQSIGEAFVMLREGQAKAALAGATDSMLNPLGLGGFSLLKVLSDENDQPQRACRPFDASRKGTVLGEGAAFVVMEPLENALERKSNIYAEVVGYGSSMDAFRVSDPDTQASGSILSMTKSLEDAELRPEDIDCINAHGTGTIKNDRMETAAIKEVLGKYAYKIPIHSVKSMTGHMIAASGAVEAAAAVLTINKKQIPPTINLYKADEQCDLDYVPNQAREFYGDTVLSNSFGFGGQNATLIFKRYNDGL